MPYLRAIHSAPNHVRAVFQTSAAFFELPSGATFEDLADRLCRLAERHDGRLTRVEVETELSHESRNAQTAAMRNLFGMHDAPAGLPG